MCFGNLLIVNNPNKNYTYTLLSKLKKQGYYLG